MIPPTPVSLYQSTRLSAYAERLIHAFTGKPLTLGGPNVSQATLDENRQHVCQQLGLATRPLLIGKQVHSANSKLSSDHDFSDTDAIILLDNQHAALVLVADCVPVILYDPQQHVAAVIHAGWRGTAQQISRQTAERMITELGCQASDLIAAIGPCAAACCYEVSNEVAHQVAASVPHSKHALVQTQNASGKPHLDLKAVNRLQLETLGVTQVDVIPDCTICQPERLFSYRRGEDGRQGALIGLI